MITEKSLEIIDNQYYNITNNADMCEALENPNLSDRRTGESKKQADTQVPSTKLQWKNQHISKNGCFRYSESGGNQFIDTIYAPTIKIQAKRTDSHLMMQQKI